MSKYSDEHNEFIKKCVQDHVHIRAIALRKYCKDDDEYMKRLKSLTNHWLRMYPSDLETVITRNDDGGFNIGFERKQSTEKRGVE